jgi:hypothetical protein
VRVPQIKFVGAAASILLIFLSTACSPSSGKLEVEAQIVYKIGGPQPVARQVFQLYDADPMTLNLPRVKDKGSRLEVVMEITPHKMGDSGPYYGPFPETEAVVKPHIIKTATTDFQGKVTFDELKAGDYWIVGQAPLRNGFDEYWMYKVTIRPGENKALLSQDNSVHDF